MVDRALAIVDHLDILVNNGGMLQRADSVDVKVEEWDYVSNPVICDKSLLTLGSECELEFSLCDLSSRRKTLYPSKKREHHQHRIAQLLHWWFTSGLVLGCKRSCSYGHESVVERVEWTQHPSQRDCTGKHRYRYVSLTRGH